MNKLITKLRQKMIGYIPVVLVMIIMAYVTGCQKDATREEIIENHRKQASEKITTESRTGQHELVYADSSSVIFPTNPADSMQTLVNLRLVDSITYVSPPPYRDLSYNGVYCWEYDITWYSGQETYTRRVFAKYRGVNYKKYPDALEGLQVGFFWANFVKTSQTIPYWDWACLKSKFQHLYNIRKMEDGQMIVYQEYIPSSVCTTNTVNFKRLFKR